MSSDIEHLRQQHEAAKAARWRLESEAQRREEQAKQEVVASYRPDITRAKKAEIDAKHALDAAMIAEAAKQPLVGKRVRKKMHQRRYGWQEDATEIEGIVEVFTHDSQRPANHEYWLPKVGELAVRLLKKDGTPGIKVERLSDDWKPIEEPQP